MPRYPTELIERVKREASIRTWLEGRGCMFTKHGRDVVCRCPFPEHEDRTPSFVVSEARNLWHCLGACQAGGSVIDLVMRLEGCEFRAAVETLLQAFPHLAGETPAPAKGKVPLITPTMADDEILAAVMRYYHHRLPEVREASAYLERRGITPAAIARFKIGVADRTLGLEIPGKQVRDGRLVREALQRLGIFRSSGHEAFTGRVVFPITDAAGRIVHIYGRRYTDGQTPHLYREGPHAGVFNLRGITAAPGWCVLCESIIDAVTFWCADVANVTTAYGTNGFTDAMLETLQAHGIRDVLIAFDRDEAGDAGAAAVAERLHAVGINAWRVRFPGGMDANAYAMSTQPAPKALGIALRAVTWLGDGPAPASPVDRAAGPVAVSAPTNAASAAASPAVSSLAAKDESADEPALQVHDGGAEWSAGDGPAARHYRLQGLGRFKPGEAGKVTIALRCHEGRTVDTVDVYQRKQRVAFAAAAAEDCGADAAHVQRDLGELVERLEAWAAAASPAGAPPDPVAAMPSGERAEAEALLRDPELVERSVQDLERCGLIGETTNKLVGLVALVSRKLRRPLALLIQSLSGAGKTALMEGLLAFVPEEERVQYSAMTGRSVFYLGDSDLRHKILALVEEEGAHDAAYALKLLQSEGKLTIASTGKDPQTGKLTTHDYTVEGPVMLVLTTTAAEIDDELQNRCLVVSVDEARAQTRAVQDVQRLRCTLHGLLRDTDRARLTTLHQNAQRLLKPLPVVNPYAEHLTFPDHQTRLRRDHAKYLGLIEAITLWHQFQRPLKTVEHDGQRIDYIETTLSDIALANRIAHEVLGRSVDELAPQARRLLGIVHDVVGELAAQEGCERRQVRFTRRQVREACGWSDTALKVHIARLVDLEYVIMHRQHHMQSARFELAWEGDPSDSAPQFGGLIDVAELERIHG